MGKRPTSACLQVSLFIAAVLILQIGHAQAEDAVAGNGQAAVSAPTGTTPAATGGHLPQADHFPTLGQYLGDVPQDLAGGAKQIFSRDNLTLALVGTGMTLLALPLDRSAQTYFEDHKPIGNSTRLGDTLGKGPALGGIVAGLFIAGEITGDRKLADTGMASGEALVVDVAVVEALKYLTQRKRPNGGNHMSFPSGHASATATLAASVTEMYDWDLSIAVPLYAVTAYVGASRIQSGEHHLSDVVAGTVLGTIIGRSYASYFAKKRAADARARTVRITPYVDGASRGLILSIAF